MGGGGGCKSVACWVGTLIDMNRKIINNIGFDQGVIWYQLVYSYGNQTYSGYFANLWNIFYEVAIFSFN